MKRKIMIINLFGMDGVGKTTHAKSLVSYLTDREIKCIYYHTHEYVLNRTDSVSENQIRTYQKFFTLWPIIAWFDNKLYYKRFFHEQRKDNVIITDRYFYDKVAKFLSLGVLNPSLAYLYIRSIPRPDLNIFVDAPSEVAFARKPEHTLREFIILRKIYYWISGQLDPSPTIIRTDREFNDAQNNLRRLVTPYFDY